MENKMSTIHSIPKTSEINWNPRYSLCEAINHSYKNAIKKGADWICTKTNPQIGFAVKAVSALVQEPFCVLKIIFSIPFGCKKNLQKYNLNPDRITKKEAEKEPILLLHGGFHNQAIWLPFAKKIQSVKDAYPDSNLGPLYTVNLSATPATPLSSNTDQKTISLKIAEIKKQYSRHYTEQKINLIGYCSGSVKAFSQLNEYEQDTENSLISFLISLFKLKLTIGKIIMIAGPSYKRLRDLHLQNIYEIDGNYDCLMPPSLLKDNYRFTAQTGHLGIMFSDPVFRYITLCLTNKL